ARFFVVRPVLPGFVEIRAHADHPVQVGAALDDRADAHDGVGYVRVRDDAALSGEGGGDGAEIDLRGRQVAAVAEYRRVFKVQVEIRVDRGKADIRLVEVV